MAKERDFQKKKWGIYADGLSEIGIGTIGIITAGFEEVGSGGFATALVITQLTLSIDEASGGINKILNPREVFEGKKAKPLKFTIGEFLGENGERIYDIIDVTLGVTDIPKARKLIDVIGIYDTVSDAQGIIEDEVERQKKEDD